jgi:zinc transport system substrate-binding protein
VNTLTRVVLLATAGFMLAACSEAAAGRLTVVASVYPLAWDAERIAGPDWEVVDLTPPGVEAHDVELSLEARAALETADLVLYLGDIGFQPQVEAAVEEANGPVMAMADELLHAPQMGPPEGSDPHLWLSPGTMRTASSLIANHLMELDPENAGAYRQRAERVKAELAGLEERFAAALDLTACRYRTAIVSHEAFNYLIGRYGFDQFGLAGLQPEGEPTAARLGRAGDLLEQGRAGAVFYEPDEEARRVAESLAADHGVPAYPLSTLESRPESGDYLSVMEDNLEALRRGLGCP